MDDDGSFITTIGYIPARFLETKPEDSPEEAPVLVPAPSSPVKLAKIVGPPSMPKWEVETRERIRAAIKRFNRPLTALRDRDANEGDTRVAVTAILVDGLGYDPFEDLTMEFNVKGDFADYGVRVDKQMVAFIEVKRIATKLSARHLLQVQNYAIHEGVEWCVLTNGATWKLYHIGLTDGALPIVVELAMEVDLLGPETPQQKAATLYYLTRVAFKRRLIDDFWKAKSATSPKSLARAVLAPPVVEAIRREIKKQTDHKSTDAEISELLRTTVLRAECLAK
jgi:predicted type IV restriction endonuclease